MTTTETTPSLVAKVHAALEECGGNRTEAAKLLGLDLERFNKLICSTTLKERWAEEGEGGQEKAPDDIDGWARRQISPEEERVAMAYNAESAKFRLGLLNSKLLSGGQVEMAKELQALSNRHMKELMDVTNASLSILTIMLVSEAKNVETRLAGVRATLAEMGGDISEERMAAIEEEKSLSMQLNHTSDTARKIKAATDQGAMTLAVIKYRLKNGMNAKKAKPGFCAIDVQPVNETSP